VGLMPPAHVKRLQSHHAANVDTIITWSAQPSPVIPLPTLAGTYLSGGAFALGMSI
jgi:hypothetical protein